MVQLLQAQSPSRQCRAVFLCFALFLMTPTFTPWTFSACVHLVCVRVDMLGDLVSTTRGLYERKCLSCEIAEAAMWRKLLHLSYILLAHTVVSESAGV
eukprot:6211187-Pleurochrysis_carterae.AAC.8